ncbi:hypothetical protein AB0B51_32365, partial [Streptomyces griseus]
INASSNLGALTVFAWQGNVLWVLTEESTPPAGVRATGAGPGPAVGRDAGGRPGSAVSASPYSRSITRGSTGEHRTKE